MLASRPSRTLQRTWIASPRVPVRPTTSCTVAGTALVNNDALSEPLAPFLSVFLVSVGSEVIFFTFKSFFLSFNSL